ncbi:MAG: chemotaxis protein CheB [Rhodanobacter sp.]
MSRQPLRQKKPTAVVGIGASAGGVEALSLFFDHERGGTGAAFLVVMHLSRDRASHLADILVRHSGMPVTTAEHGMRIMAEHIYVMPPGVFMTVGDGRLQLKESMIAERVPSVIDRFFNSLAQHYGDHAIGIVLSGTGADGALGLKSIKERGGLTIAQGDDGSVPMFDGMPRSAIATGIIDLQLSVEEIGPRLVSAIHDITKTDQAAEAFDSQHADRLRLEIAEILQAQLNHDFSGYKPSTFLRRVRRRMSVLELAHMEAYVDHLRKTPSEANLLFRDLLISVTSFFRDSEAFEAIERFVIPELFKGKFAGDEIRVWVPGCATGEEAYSLGMLLLEHAETVVGNTPAIRIFATDIDERALAIARRGRYPSVLLESVSGHRRDTFFIEDRDSWSVQKRLREVCTFSPHNALRDPPFSRIDLVSCRNLLIYLGPEFQSRILPILHYALRPEGFLFVGVAEGVTRHSGLFAPVSKAQRIFSKLPVAPGSAALPKLSSSARKLTEPFAATGGQMSSAAMRRQIETRILEAHTPPYVLVNAQGDALFYSGRTGGYLEFPSGAPSRHLLNNARKELRLGLRRALHDAVTSQERVVLPYVELAQDGGPRRLQLSVEPFDDGDSPLYLVLFNDQGPAPERNINPDEAVARTMEQMERDLRESRDQLQSTYEEFETAIEELRVANEELMSVNEELQSSNEELETSKEELQSVNDELQTVNHELADNVEALDQSNADLRGSLESTGIATIFLDRAWRYAASPRRRPRSSP